MPIIDDMLRGLQIQIDTLWYNLLFTLAGLGWSVQRAFLMMGYTIELMNQWLIDNAFAPLIAQTNASLQIAVTASFAIALIVLGITYTLAAFARMRVVEPKSAIAWYLAGALFFALGPQLYQGMSDLRRDLGQAFYASSLTGLQGATGSAFSSLSDVASTDLGLISLCDNFGSYMPVWNRTVDGLDVALAYLRADGIDLMGYPSVPRDLACQAHTPDPVTGLWTAGSVPWEWRRPGSFFANDRDPVLFSVMTDDERAASINMASASMGRLLTAWPLILFGVAEQTVYLLLTVAQGLTFMSFGVAILFAFFKKTEVIARSIVDLWIELLVQTIIIALIQALIVTFFLAAVASNNGIVVLGIGLICLVFTLIVLWSGLKAVWNAFNRLFNAFGQAAGGAIVSPGMAAVATAAGAVGAAGVAGLAAGGAVSIGSSAMAGAAALRSGATPAQAAGMVLGGNQTLSGAARALTHLPGVRDTSLGTAAEQFAEGAYVRRVARELPVVGRFMGPMIGKMLLTDHDPENAQYDEQGRTIMRPMLVPAVGDGLDGWTRPLNRRKGAAAGEENPDGSNTTHESPPVETVRSRRTGIFLSAPSEAEAAVARERQIYANDMRGEELENHITERLGNLRITGSADIASVMGDVMRLLSGHGVMGIDHLSVGLAIARALGVTPNKDGTPPVRDDLSRFGVFIDQAARLGLTPDQTERVGREINETPDRRLPDGTRTELVEQIVKFGSTRDAAEREITRLEVTARLLPNTLIAYGTMPASPSQDNRPQAVEKLGNASMTGSGAVLGGTE